MKLRKLQEKDIPGMLEWMHDPDLNQYFLFDASNQTEEQSKIFVQRSMSSTNKHFAIADDKDVYQGTISLKNISYANQTAEFALSLRKQAIGTGTAAWATKELLQKAFNEFKLNRVYCNVLSDNIRSQRYVIKAGFQYEGEFVCHVKKNQQFKNLKWYAILKEEYEARI
ncbi:MAG: GNAT family protein [Ruthenibacterium sp.]